MKNKVVGFGDLLVRLAAPGYQRLIQAHSFDVYYTGAEANVLAFLALNGVKTSFVTRLPENLISTCAISHLHRYDIGTEDIVFGGDRIGSYYLERGASQRPSRLVYDRKYTSIATASKEDFDWDSIFEDAGYFHLTGITPALGKDLPDICLEACRKAKEKDITVSCDLNYRKALWSASDAKKAMERILPFVDVLIGNEEDSEKVLGIKPKGTDVTRGVLDRSAYESVARELTERFGFKMVSFTLRESISASDNNWSGMLYKDGDAFFSRRYPIHIVDRVGGGDSFSAGIIYSMIHGYDPQHTVEFAAAASCLKQTIEYDFNLTTAAEVEQLIQDGGSGRIQR